MKLIVSHALLTESGAAMQQICAALSLPDYDQVDPALIPEVDTKHYSVKHVLVGVGTGRMHTEIVVSDAAIIRCFAVYMKVAKFVAPIIQACLAFSVEMKSELQALEDFLLEE